MSNSLKHFNKALFSYSRCNCVCANKQNMKVLFDAKGITEYKDDGYFIIAFFYSGMKAVKQHNSSEITAFSLWYFTVFLFLLFKKTVNRSSPHTLHFLLGENEKKNNTALNKDFLLILILIKKTKLIVLSFFWHY